MQPTNSREWDDEKQYLQQVLVTIQEEINRFNNKRQTRQDDIVAYRRYMWENIREFQGGIEVSEYENALRDAVRSHRSALGRAEVLKRAYHMPYFARIDFQEQGLPNKESFYIGLTSILDSKTLDILVCDWRAPVSSMYYDYDMGPACYEAPEGKICGKLLLKRQFKIKHGQIQLAVDTGIRVTDDLLLETLSQNRSEKMQQIVYTIQKEQNRIIRDEQNRVLLIQGAAGSGKTSIALHRMAYLLYRKREKLRPEQCLVFSPNVLFIDYISDVLPELGEQNTRQTTFYDYALYKLKKYGCRLEDISEQMEALLSSKSHSTRHQVVKYKMSVAFEQALQQYVVLLNQKEWKFKDVMFAHRRVLKAEELASLFNEHFKRLPLNQRAGRVVERAVAMVAARYKKVNEEKLREAITTALPEINAFKAYRDLFKDLRIWSKLGTVAYPEQLAAMSKYTLDYLDKQVIPYEDLAPLLYLFIELEGGCQNTNMKQVVIDEVQDYTEMQLKLLRRVFPYAAFTLLGDVHQAIHPAYDLQLSNIQHIFGAECQTVYLKKCYRSTQEITSLTRSMLKAPDMVEAIGRSGEPVVYHVLNEQIEIELITKEVRALQDKGYESIAIIVKTQAKCNRLFEKLKHHLSLTMLTGVSREFAGRLVLLPSYVSKGLEFDAVLVPDADCNSYHSEEDRKLFYTVCTRALHVLKLFTKTHPVSFISEDHSALVLQEDI